MTTLTFWGKDNITRLSTPTTTVVLAIVSASYLLLVQCVRYRGQKANETLYNDNIIIKKEDNEKDLIKENKKAAEIGRQIQLNIASYEFPLVYRLSLEFALFRTYAIPSISKLLEQTKEFELQAGKRYDDIY